MAEQSEKYSVIICGHRDFTNYDMAKNHLARLLGYNNLEIVSGGCIFGTPTFIRTDKKRICGADGLGERFAKENNIPVKCFDADWTKNGRAAGPLRNDEMAQYARAVIAFWDGKSKGTADMLKKAKEYNREIKIIMF